MLPVMKALVVQAEYSLEVFGVVGLDFVASQYWVKIQLGETVGKLKMQGYMIDLVV